MNESLLRSPRELNNIFQVERSWSGRESGGSCTITQCCYSRGLESGSTESLYALKQVYKIFHSLYGRCGKNGAQQTQFTESTVSCLWTSDRALLSTITQYFHLQQKTYMEWRKYKKKKKTDHTFQKGIVLKNEQRKSEW